ncbi:STM4012 family radical SAM protein [Virgisporangium aurantiacum]|uniref:Heme chaperone HemW n=1 Tax=Virgisporangium aurantiacum TaxID=175570 RepID=A0A8J3ZBJ6_9ACTN|nr:STM4012 family radical SAM protein [Virgisporangium aurantiacum]GIJ58253.1 coproporphyrinogen III oxidase [Virgisporangium aurantiacum]
MLGSPYQGYLYAYPHKTAYRPLRPRPALRDVWAGEDTRALFCYVHVPFCEMRCGFCNLFTRANPPAEQVSAYLAQLTVQAERVRDALPGGTEFARVAIGGGTPTYLTAPELERLFDVVDGFTGGARVPLGVETSPATATPDRLAVLAARGVTRVSIGVQSFLDDEAHRAGRPQRRAEVDRALAAIRASAVDTLNLDLIYGIPGQTAATWEYSLATALSWRPEELYLYPLYVRPLTGLGRRGAAEDPLWDAERLALYRRAVEVLAGAGYRQESMRMFRLASAPVLDGPEYCCQDDGMVGLGCGARSYTTGLHYSFDYAVGIGQVRAIIDDYLGRPATDFDVAEYGFALDALEQRRRWLLKSLLRVGGVRRAGYAARFGSTVDDDFPQLVSLAESGFLDANALRLTADGLAYSDAIGPWLVSPGVRAAMAGYATR